jgi:serine phosphatase RsbU (regulator of sigma subunit)
MAIRERLEQQSVREEARVACEIQSSMSPKRFLVPGLDIAFLTISAAESGGDYCDVLPGSDGAWLAIGDVTGHGLVAGLVMLMIQSMVSILVQSDWRMKPSRMATLVNASLYENVRHRLCRDDHATLTLLRYERSGHVEFAGAHDPLIVYRAATGRCEAIIPPGVWVGAVPDVRGLMRDDAELYLCEGDLLVLYTDGVLEPRNAHLEQFGLERLLELIEVLANRRVEEIRDEIVATVRAWSSNLEDDITLLVARYVGETVEQAVASS